MTSPPAKKKSTKPWRTLSHCRVPLGKRFESTAAITADDLVEVREPVRWALDLGARVPPDELRDVICRGMRGPASQSIGPIFLWRHQIDAYQRAVAALHLFGGALLCDAVGLGKTYVSLAIAQRYDRVTVVVPSTILKRWQWVARRVGSRITAITHDALSRGHCFNQSDLVIIDEAHRVRNPETKRYQMLAQSIGSAHVLLVTATPIVNTPLDLLHLIRLFMPDHGLSIMGLPSLESALTKRRSRDVLRPVSSILIARTPNVVDDLSMTIPKTFDSPTIETAPLAESHLGVVLDQIAELGFPTFDDKHSAELLRLHMLHRLSSSTRALLQTIRRHRAYLRRATKFAQQGEELSRRNARRLFGPDELPQLDLELFAGVSTPRTVDLIRIAQEMGRLDALQAVLQRPDRNNAKLAELLQILRARSGLKTVVFATAVATAMEIAEALRWKSVVVVSGTGARIASGPIPLQDAVSLFAPLANGRCISVACEHVDVLITTDVLSEGLNLQDADMVIHYDLPWTPLRLQQRIGRIARLGSPFDRVYVRWFVPPPILEDHLGIARRITAKAAHQRRFGVPMSSRVGAASVTHETMESRERLSARAARQRSPKSRYAVVRAGHVAAFAIEWSLPHGTVPDVFVFQGTPPVYIDALDSACRILEEVISAPSSNIDPAWMPHEALITLVRERWAATLLGPRNTETKKLMRLVIARAKGMTRTRRFDGIDGLDGILERLSAGIPIGGERTLRDLLTNESTPGERQSSWKRWNRRWERPLTEVCSVRIEAAIIGDGLGDRLRITAG